jgi:nuclear pore complex protein Nup107
MDRAYKAKLKAVYGEVENTVPEVVKTLLDEPAITSLPSIPTVRNIYIPELVLALHRFYVEAGKYMEPRVVTNALELATVVADPERNILDTFRATGRLAEYVDQIAGASRNVLGAAQEGAKEAQGIWTVEK